MTVVLRHARLRRAARRAALACAWSAIAGAAQPEPLGHVVRPGDTLYDLAQAYLEDPQQWPELARANGDPSPRRLRPGSVILIPDELLRRKPGGATVVHVSGEVSYATRGGAAAPLQPGMRLIDGDSVRTASGGFASLEMADGSIVRVVGDSELRLERLRYSLVKKRADTGLALDKGRIESRVAPQKPSGSQFRVDTPLMAAGVRGTEFGVSVQDGARATSDVLSGAVQLRVAQSGSTADLAAGMGGAVAAGAAQAVVAPLLPAPDLSGIQALQQRPLIDIAFPALGGAALYRAFIWPGDRAERVAANVVANGPRVRFAGLDDGAYTVRVSAVDAQGIEGRPATRAITLKARPEPPITMAPADGATVEQAETTLRWAQVPEAIGYRLQLARDPDFTDLLIDEARVEGGERIASGLASGNYYWHVATIVTGRDGQPDVGPYGDPRRFMVRRPTAAAVGAAQNGDEIVFSWDGEPGQRYLVQIARDAGFLGMVDERRIAERQLALQGLPAGEYFLRIQATDGDGYVREFSRPQRFRVQRFVRSGDGALRTSDGQEVGSP